MNNKRKSYRSAFGRASPRRTLLRAYVSADGGCIRACAHQHDKRNAFTLVELMVTVSIIAMLIAILVPSLKTARGQAKGVVCQSNLRQIGIGLWSYMADQNGHVPHIISPMTNGNGLNVPGFADPKVPSEAIDPFDRERWPESLPNILMPMYIGQNPDVFVCPAAINGWPREGPFRYTYRPAAANQPNGIVSAEGSYFRENFGFLDGRTYREFVIKYTGNPIVDAQLRAKSQSTYLRDFVTQEGGLHGPHRKGMNVMNRTLAVEFRNHQSVTDHLGGFGGGASF